MPKVLIAKEGWDGYGQNFYQLTSVETDNPEGFIELIKKLQYVPLLVGEYNEIYTDVPTGGFDCNGNQYYHHVSYLKITEKDFLNNILEVEKEYGECFKEEADIVRKYLNKTTQKIF